MKHNFHPVVPPLAVLMLAVLLPIGCAGRQTERGDSRPNDCCESVDTAPVDGRPADLQARDTVPPPPISSWSRRFGTASDDVAFGLAVDAAGNVYVVGYSSGSADFCGVSPNSTSKDVFAASYSPTGALRWCQRHGSAQVGVMGLAAGVGTGGHLFVSGVFKGTISFGGPSLTSIGSSDIFLASYDTDGTHGWSKRLGTAAEDYAMDLAVDGGNNVTITGWSGGPVDFGGGPLAGGGGFVASFAQTGVHRWSKTFAGRSAAIAADSSDNVYLAGWFWGKTDLGGGTLEATATDGFVASLSSSGAHRWSHGLGASAYVTPRELAVTPGGEARTTGDFNLTLEAGADKLTTVGEEDVFLVGSDATGAHQWARRFGGVKKDYGTCLALDPAGNIYLAGSFQETADFGCGELIATGETDTVLASYAPDGTCRWSKRFGGDQTVLAEDLARDSAGNLYLVGRFWGTVDFGTGVLASAGSADGYVVKLAATGLEPQDGGT